MLGVIIGVAAVVIIVAIGQGAKIKMTEELFSTEKNAVDIWYQPMPVEGEDESEMFWVEPELTAEDVGHLIQSSWCRSSHCDKSRLGPNGIQ